jgi:hypothetical protein
MGAVTTSRYIASHRAALRLFASALVMQQASETGSTSSSALHES